MKYWPKEGYFKEIIESMTRAGYELFSRITTEPKSRLYAHVRDERFFFHVPGKAIIVMLAYRQNEGRMLTYGRNDGKFVHSFWTIGLWLPDEIDFEFDSYFEDDFRLTFWRGHGCVFNQDGYSLSLDDNLTALNLTDPFAKLLTAVKSLLPELFTTLAVIDFAPSDAASAFWGEFPLEEVEAIAGHIFQ